MPSGQSEGLEAGDAVAADHQLVVHHDPRRAAVVDDLVISTSAEEGTWIARGHHAAA